MLLKSNLSSATGNRGNETTSFQQASRDWSDASGICYTLSSRRLLDGKQETSADVNDGPFVLINSMNAPLLEELDAV